MTGNEYVEVRANLAMQLDANPSDMHEGWETEGKHVNWDENGFTGTDWYNTVTVMYHGQNVTVNGPMYGKTDTQIEEAVGRGNLNTEFTAWTRAHDIDYCSAWVLYVESITGCVVGI